MWPKSPEILTKATFEHNIPFILSTVTTSNIETIAEITEGKILIQLYHPANQEVTNDIIKRIEQVSCPVLVILADVPSFTSLYKKNLLIVNVNIISILFA